MLNAVFYVLTFSGRKLWELPLVLCLTEAVSTHSVQETIEEDSHRMLPLILSMLVCGSRSWAMLTKFAKVPVRHNGLHMISYRL